MTNYRIKRKFAWLPERVWVEDATPHKPLGNYRIGVWETIWLRRWFIIEELHEGSNPGEDAWIYCIGDYKNIMDAEYCLNQILNASPH